MELASSLLGAVRFVLSRADRGRVIALRAATTAMSAMSSIGKHCSNQESLAAAIEVEIFLESWRRRHPSAEAQR
jgi:hypothetical protein